MKLTALIENSKRELNGIMTYANNRLFFFPMHKSRMLSGIDAHAKSPQFDGLRPDQFIYVQAIFTKVPYTKTDMVEGYKTDIRELERFSLKSEQNPEITTYQTMKDGEFVNIVRSVLNED